MAKKVGNPQSKIAAVILQYFIIFICIAFVVIAIGQGGFYYLRTSPIFKIREVVSRQSLNFIRTQTLDRLIGQSIFDVDLYAVQRRLQVEYPQIDHLRLYRQFPNRIYVDAIRRDPFAVVLFQHHQILLDKDGVVLSLTVPSNHKFPLITGLTLEQNTVVGKSLRHADLMLALTIITNIRDNLHLASMPVVSLDLTNLSEIRCVLANELRVILSAEKVQQKIAMLGIVMSEGQIQAQEIKYIDLRFREPIISKK